MSPCSTCIFARPIPYALTEIGCHHPAVRRHLGAGPAPVTETIRFWFSVNFEPTVVTSCTGQTLVGSTRKTVANREERHPDPWWHQYFSTHNAAEEIRAGLAARR